MLAESTWGGNSYHMRFASPGDVSAWLKGTDVTLAIVQPNGRPHQPQLLEALHEDSARWHELPPAACPRGVRIFERAIHSAKAAYE